jgi:4-aminobutyrate aminotransferase
MDWPPGAHASTFGGNPVSIAAALATIELLEAGLVNNAARVGAYILNRIAGWPEVYPQVGDTRGLGLMIGIELIEDRATRKPAAALRDHVVQQAFHKGLLLLGCGKSTLRLSPPLIITTEQADFAIDVVEECVRELAQRV